MKLSKEGTDFTDIAQNKIFSNIPMKIIEDEYEGGFVITFPDLPGCLACGGTMELALANAEDAKKAWLEAEAEVVPDKLAKLVGRLSIGFSSSK